MNERIKEFIEQATTEEHDGFRYFDKAKFAKLIVKECADVGERYANGNYEVYNQILEHFGVEE